ncbi:MAG TPA: hypothetical protein VFQ85_18730 [Mycobacteriales bacterium]|jgi:Na+-transporting methylmalonyl-CoA/oxaloacetate decarboxylase gamma subunit|nr:hypothetical protein [Mycobacteriales bacterium]
MPPERCPRCGTPRRADLQVCVRCEHRFDGTEADVDLAVPRPAAPSPTQSHGTVMVALLSGFVVLAFLLWLSVRGVGPFEGQVVKTEPATDKTRVTVSITNKGSKAGHGRCRIARIRDTGDRTTDFQFLSGRVLPHQTITETVEVPVEPGVTAGQVDC